MNAQVGQKATMYVGSDAYPVTIISVTQGARRLIIQHDKFVGDEGHDYYGKQKWKITRNQNGRTEALTWKPKIKRYSKKGEGSTGWLAIGVWEARKDPSF